MSTHIHTRTRVGLGADIGRDYLIIRLPSPGGIMTKYALTRRSFLKTAAAGAAVAGTARPARAQTKTFKIGAVHPVTGPLAEPGQACRLGAQLAVEAINAAGGV